MISKSASIQAIIYDLILLSFYSIQNNSKHVVFGRVVDGFDVVDQIENTPKGASDKPTVDVVISDCGELKDAVSSC